MSTNKLITPRYLFLSALIIVLAGGLVLLPKFEKQEGIAPELLLSNAISPERYISTDELADRIISNDPSILLIDVRDEASFNENTLPNSVNIPLDQLLNEDFEGYLDQAEYDVILFSNDSFKADQAWILCNRLDYKNLHVLKGGINEWFNTIINPKKPSENMPQTEYNLYSFRKAASMYFGVMYVDQVKKPDSKKAYVAPKKTTTTPKVVVPKKKKKKMPVEGGC
ncbi:Rhodanese-related sulfurtransferase [Lutibacter oricola]|uniref:Rhodanese-related sulfurtransferase n=1 Tax=Lutibacter oricola TaxID=762486 RepID=A0A1H3CFK3_9FLAO|nr:rhodanese-like domain-containing protein [Lutibacter oricola]SDX52921.1 Rhodanese-related sulfurtransferase [Lutibacter oricola]